MVSLSLSSVKLAHKAPLRARVVSGIGTNGIYIAPRVLTSLGPALFEEQQPPSVGLRPTD